MHQSADKNWVKNCVTLQQVFGTRELTALQYGATDVMYIFRLLCTAVLYFRNEKQQDGHQLCAVTKFLLYFVA